jgi:hypothetical protein
MAHVWLQERARVGPNGPDLIALYVRNNFVRRKSLIKKALVIA